MSVSFVWSATFTGESLREGEPLSLLPPPPPSLSVTSLSLCHLLPLPLSPPPSPSDTSSLSLCHLLPLPLTPPPSPSVTSSLSLTLCHIQAPPSPSVCSIKSFELVNTAALVEGIWLNAVLYNVHFIILHYSLT